LLNDNPVEAVIDEDQEVTEQPGEQIHGSPLDTRQGSKGDPARRPGKQMVEGKSFRLARGPLHQRRAADRHGRVVTVAQLVLLSTETGDAWLLDPSDQLAARLARDRDPEPVHIEETSSSIGRATIASRDPPCSHIPRLDQAWGGSARSAPVVRASAKFSL